MEVACILLKLYFIKHYLFISFNLKIKSLTCKLIAEQEFHVVIVTVLNWPISIQVVLSKLYRSDLQVKVSGMILTHPDRMI